MSEEGAEPHWAEAFASTAHICSWNWQRRE